jgi:hypothetical protein
MRASLSRREIRELEKMERMLGTRAARGCEAEARHEEDLKVAFACHFPFHFCSCILCLWLKVSTGLFFQKVVGLGSDLV